MSADGLGAARPICSCRCRPTGGADRGGRVEPAGLEMPSVVDTAPVSGAAVGGRQCGRGDDDAVTAERARRRYWRQRAWSSRVLHRLGQLTSHAGAGLMAGGVVLGWLVVGLVIHFPAWWENVLYIASSLTTLIMVFAVQHTQARQAAATQRKLDELLRAIPTADNQLIALEEVSEQQLQQLNHRSIIDRETAPRPTRDDEVA
jgi:low affinity Fe/Cu permease